MPETPHQWFERVRGRIDAGGYRESDLQGWSVWPWTGELTPKPLDPPADAEPDRRGARGVDCQTCVNGADPAASADVLWFDGSWMVTVPFGGTSLPFSTRMFPRRHADLQDLTPEESARQGVLLTAVEQAACATLSVPRIQVARWGDGGEHLHWWLYARPTGQLQLRGTFLSHWDDLLPLRDAAELRVDLDAFGAELARVAGGSAVPAT